MEYVLKVSAIVIVFYFGYRTLLQKITFFRINRWFLILGILMSFTLPLIVIPVYHEYTSVEVPVTMFHGTQEQTNMEPITEPFDILDYLPIVYGIGISFFSIQFFIRLFSLFKVINKNKSHKKEGYIFIETTDELSPFSFFKWIVYNPNQFNTSEISQIIAHEKAHAKQYHSIDILFMEICCVLLWFHPLVWLYNKSVKQNLEFLADKYALHQCNDTKSYQYTLLKASVPNHQTALSNHFYNSLIKKRIAMLQKSRSKKINLLKYALVVPVLTLFLMSFNTEDVYLEEINTMYPNDARIVIDKNTSDIEFSKITNTFKEDYNIGVSYKGIKRNFKNELSRITVELMLTDSLTFSKTQKSMDNIGAIEPFVITYNPVMKSIDVRDLKDEKKKDAKIIIDKNTSDIQLKINRDLFKEKHNIDIVYDNIKRNVSDELTSITIDLFNKYGKLSTYQDGETAIKSFIIEYDSDTEEMKTYMLKNIDTFSGNVSIKTINNTQTEKKPIYIVDGKEISNAAFKKINPDDIFAINVFKDKLAIEKYGEKGKDGVVEIITKGENNEFVMVLDKNTSNSKLEEYKKSYKEKFKSDLIFDVRRNSKKEITFYDILYSLDGKRSFTDKDREDDTPISPILIKYDGTTKVLHAESIK